MMKGPSATGLDFQNRPIMAAKAERRRTFKGCSRRRRLCLVVLLPSFLVAVSRNSCFGWTNKAFGFPFRRGQVSSTKLSSTIESSAVYSSPLLSSCSFSPESLMDPIVNHPSVQLLDIERRPRKKLKPRHKHFFLSSTNATNSNTTVSNHPSLFEKLAIACCDSGVVPRKEFFETYAAAKIIHDSFPKGVYRIADLAAGHGLLSWMLLAMDEYSENGFRNDMGSDHQTHRTAICVDRRMPPSALSIAKSMREQLFPIEDSLDGAPSEISGDALLYDYRWTYVETDLGNVVVDDSSTLLVSVHACGTLSDYLIEMAISGSAPLSLVPCCHTYSARKGYAPHPSFSGTTADEVRLKIESLQNEIEDTDSNAPVPKKARATKTHQKFQIVENVIDEVRWQTLRNAGYGDIRIANLPKVFTERNRLFLAHGQTSDTHSVETDLTETDKSNVSQANGNSSRQSIRRGSMPPIVDDTTTPASLTEQQSIFTVTIRDEPEDILQCLSVSGKAKAIERLRTLLPNHFAPKLDVSIWLTPQTETNASITTNVTLDALQDVLDTVVEDFGEIDSDGKKICCTIAAISDIFVHPKNGRIACTYQIEYSYDTTSTFEEGGSPFPKDVAKKLHKSFCETVVRCIEGTEIR